MLLMAFSLLLGRQKQKPDPVRMLIGEGKLRGCLRLLKRDHSRATSPLDLLDRADLEETVTLFRRVLDELD